jgi:hypothetical protein
VRSADALGWALTRAGQPAEGLRWSVRALRLGSRDALFLLHAGVAAEQAVKLAPQAAGAKLRREAHRYLAASLASHPPPYWAAKARAALRRARSSETQGALR